VTTEKQTQTSPFLAQASRLVQDRIRPLARKLDQEGRFPRELVGEMAEAGFFGAHYPVEYGGRGQSALTAHLLLKEIAKASAGVSLSLVVHYMAVDVLLKFGTDEQKRKYLPDLISGRKIAAYTISEMQAGSDAAAITATAVKTGPHWALQGKKYFCTNGGLAELYFVALKTDPEKGAKGISMFLIEKGTTGFTVGPVEEKLGCRSSELTALSFSGCLIHQDNIIGGINDGFKIAMYGLVFGRLGMASLGLGVAEAAMSEAAAYANRRIVFGKPLAAQFSVQQMLAEMYVQIEAGNLLAAAAAKERDQGGEGALETSVAKLFVAEASTMVCRKAAQIYGGHGYMKRNSVERYLRDAQLMSVGVGASEVLQMVVGVAVAKRHASNPEEV
jgi:alkylation response protein AidB-like acyl-CoA dehydrogenase